MNPNRVGTTDGSYNHWSETGTTAWTGAQCWIKYARRTRFPGMQITRRETKKHYINVSNLVEWGQGGVRTSHCGTHANTDTDAPNSSRCDKVAPICGLEKQTGESTRCTHVFLCFIYMEMHQGKNKVIRYPF